MSTEEPNLHTKALKVDEEPKSPAPALQRQDSNQRSIKGILKKTRSTGLEAEPPEPERIIAPVTKTSKELTVVDGKEEDKEHEEEDKEDEEVYKEGRRLQREESSSSETPRTPSPDSVGKTPSISQSEEGEESESSLDGSLSSSLKERYDGVLEIFDGLTVAVAVVEELSLRKMNNGFTTVTII